jgi:hypothetical protein
MFRVLSAPIIRSTIKTADASIGTVYVSVWLKSVERCPRSEVYRLSTRSVHILSLCRMSLVKRSVRDLCLYVGCL